MKTNKLELYSILKHQTQQRMTQKDSNLLQYWTPWNGPCFTIETSTKLQEYIDTQKGEINPKDDKIEPTDNKIEPTDDKIKPDDKMELGDQIDPYDDEIELEDEKPCHYHPDKIGFARCHDCDHLLCQICVEKHNSQFGCHFVTNFNDLLLNSIHISLLQIRRQFLLRMFQRVCDFNDDLDEQLADMSFIDKNIQNELRKMADFLQMWFRKDDEALVTDFKWNATHEIVELGSNLSKIRSLLQNSSFPDAEDGKNTTFGAALLTDMDVAIIEYKFVIQSEIEAFQRL